MEANLEYNQVILVKLTGMPNLRDGTVALSKRGIIGPFYFEENGKTTTNQQWTVQRCVRAVPAGAADPVPRAIQEDVVSAGWGQTYIPPMPPLTSSRFTSRSGSSGG